MADDKTRPEDIIHLTKERPPKKEGDLYVIMKDQLTFVSTEPRVGDILNVPDEGEFELLRITDTAYEVRFLGNAKGPTGDVRV